MEKLEQMKKQATEWIKLYLYRAPETLNLIEKRIYILGTDLLEAIKMLEEIGSRSNGRDH